MTGAIDPETNRFDAYARAELSRRESRPADHMARREPAQMLRSARVCGAG